MTPENVALRERVQKQARDGLAEQFIAEVNDGRWDAVSYDLAPGPSGPQPPPTFVCADIDAWPFSFFYRQTAKTGQSSLAARLLGQSQSSKPVRLPSFLPRTSSASVGFRSTRRVSSSRRSVNACLPSLFASPRVLNRPSSYSGLHQACRLQAPGSGPCSGGEPLHPLSLGRPRAWE
jgi:hypothetical protein